MWKIEDIDGYVYFKKDGTTEFITSVDDISDIYTALRTYYGDVW